MANSAILSMNQSRPSTDFCLNRANNKIPEEREREFDADLEMLMLNGIWQTRRIVWSKTIMTFSKVGEDILVDSIPLSEIKTIKQIKAPSIDNAAAFTRTLSVITKFKRSDSDDSLEARGTEMFDSRFKHAIQIQTIDDGFNSGRAYYIQASSAGLCQRIFDDLSTCARRARKSAEVRTRLQRMQGRVLEFYESSPVQCGVAILIFSSFVETIVSVQLIREEGTHQIMQRLDYFFTAAFTLELFVNLFAHWFWPFLTSGWHMFDLMVVALALASLGSIQIPIKALRVLRAFRVLRLFSRFRILRCIVSALTSSILPVLNAFLIIFFFASIYAIMGTTVFGEAAPEDFGSFDLAFVTVFSMTAGNYWVASIPRVFGKGENATLNYSYACFTVSYFIIINWTLLQVTIAILLNHFIRAINEEENRAAALEARSKIQEDHKNTLDPLLQKLMMDYVDDSDLSIRLRILFKILNTDDSGSLSFLELCHGLKKLDFSPCIHLTESDFSSFTQDGGLCDSAGRMRSVQFEAAVRHQIRQYSARKLCELLAHGLCSDAERIQAQTLKILLQSSLASEHNFIQLQQRMEEFRTDTKEIRKGISDLVLSIRNFQGIAPHCTNHSGRLSTLECMECDKSSIGSPIFSKKTTIRVQRHSCYQNQSDPMTALTSEQESGPNEGRRLEIDLDNGEDIACSLAAKVSECADSNSEISIDLRCVSERKIHCENLFTMRSCIEADNQKENCSAEGETEASDILKTSELDAENWTSAMVSPSPNIVELSLPSRMLGMPLGNIATSSQTPLHGNGCQPASVVSNNRSKLGQRRRGGRLPDTLSSSLSGLGAKSLRGSVIDAASVAAASTLPDRQNIRPSPTDTPSAFVAAT